MNDFFEKTLEDIVFEKRDTIHERGLDIFYKNSIRQFYLLGKRIDILTWEINDDILYARIIEFKREALKEYALFQAAEYYADFMSTIFGRFKNYHIEVILIGSKGNKNIQHITTLTDLIKVYTYSYGFDGIKFEEISHSSSKVKEMFFNFPPDDEYMDLITKLKSGK